MSLEQAAITEIGIDTRADIYSLGVVLYELLTGPRPLDADRLKRAGLNEMIRVVCEEEPSKPSTRIANSDSRASLAAVRRIEPQKLATLLRGDLDWIVMKCLEKQRGRRYATAGGLARDISRFHCHDPVEARPPSAGYRLSKFVRRHRWSVLVTSVLVTTLAAGILGTTIEWLNAQHSAAGEKQARQQAETRLQQLQRFTQLLVSIFHDLDIRQLETDGARLEWVLGKRLKQATKSLTHERLEDPLMLADAQVALSIPWPASGVLMRLSSLKGPHSLIACAFWVLTIGKR